MLCSNGELENMMIYFTFHKVAQDFAHHRFGKQSLGLKSHRVDCRSFSSGQPDGEAEKSGCHDKTKTSVFHFFILKNPFWFSD